MVRKKEERSYELRLCETRYLINCFQQQFCWIAISVVQYIYAITKCNAFGLIVCQTINLVLELLGKIHFDPSTFNQSI